MEETGQGLHRREMTQQESRNYLSKVDGWMDVNCLDFPTSYLNTLRGGQQRPGEVGVIQAVELSRWLYTFHVKAVASKDIDGISLFMVDCRVAIQT